MHPQFQTQVKAIPKASFTPVRRGLLQRCTATTECDDCCNKQPTLQRSSINHIKPSRVPPIVHDVLCSPGQSLDEATRASMESRLGHDFSQVRVHTDTRAAKSARAVNALAYTVGQDVVFGTGRYAPETPSGRQLLAHELVHTVQQGAAAPPAGTIEVSKP